MRVEPIRTAAMLTAPEFASADVPIQEPPASLDPLTIAAPDLTEPLTAFRCWRTDGERLRSPYLPVHWDERLLAARCHRPPGTGRARPLHTPPSVACGCGIHAYYQPNLEFPTIDYRGVTGIVTLRGEVAVRPDGMLAEVARVEALGFYSRWSKRQQRQVSVISERLQVDLVDLDELEAAAERYGRPLLPDALSAARTRPHRLGVGGGAPVPAGRT